MNEMKQIMNGWEQEMILPDAVTEKAQDAFAKIRKESAKTQAHMAARSLSRHNRTGMAGHRSRRRKGFAAVLIAAAVLGTVGFAASRSRLTDWFQKEFSSPEAQEQIVTGIPVTVSGQEHVPNAYVEDGTEDLFWSRPVIPDADPLLTIEEAQFDGSSLYIYASATENGKQYDLGADRLYINDQEYGPVGMSSLKQYTDEDGYTIVTDLSDLHLTEDFTVTLPISVYKGDERYQNQELTFTMSAEANIQTVEKQTFEHPGYRIEVDDITVTTNVVKYKVRYIIDEEKQKELEQNGQALASSAQADGAELCSPYLGHDLPDGFEEEYSYAGVPSEADSIVLKTILCEKGGYVSEGEVISEDILKIR